MIFYDFFNAVMRSFTVAPCTSPVIKMLMVFTVDKTTASRHKLNDSNFDIHVQFLLFSFDIELFVATTEKLYFFKSLPEFWLSEKINNQ